MEMEYEKKRLELQKRAQDAEDQKKQSDLQYEQSLREAKEVDRLSFGFHSDPSR